MADGDELDDVEQPEGLPGDQQPDAPEAPEPAERVDAEPAEPTVPKAVFEAKEAELLATRRLADAALARQQPAQQQGPGFQRNPQYENDPYTQYLDQRYGPVLQGFQGQVAQLANENDFLRSRTTIDETYGRGTYRKLADTVEAEFQAKLQSGRPESREQIFYATAGRQGLALTPVTERSNSETKTALRKAKPGAMVESGAPVARRTERTPKPLADMSKDELAKSIQNDPQYKNGF